MAIMSLTTAWGKVKAVVLVEVLAVEVQAVEVLVEVLEQQRQVQKHKKKYHKCNPLLYQNNYQALKTTHH